MSAALGTSLNKYYIVMQCSSSVLVADSDFSSLSSIVENLVEQGFNLLTASNGQQCLETASIAFPDLILLDAALPDGDGLDVCRRIKSQDLTRHIPVIFMATLDDEEQRLACFEAGGADFLPKPLRLREAVARIKVHLQLPAALPPRMEEQSFRAIADHSPDVIVRYDRECRRIYVSQSYLEAHDLSPAAVLGKKPSDIWKSTSMTAEAFESELRRVMDTGCRADIEFDWQKTPDELTHFWLRAVPEYDHEGKAISVLAMARDITAMKRTEAELASREQDFRTLIENIPDNIIRYAKDLRIRYANPIVAETIGIPQEEWIGKYPHELNPSPVFDEYYAILKEVIQTGKPADYLLVAERNAALQGREIYDNIRFVPEFAADGSVTGAIAIGRNLLQQRKLELEVALREEKFRTLAENIPAPIVRYDLDGRRIYSNRAYLNNSPMAEDSLGKTALECWWRDTPTAEEFMSRLRHVIETKALDEFTVVSTEKEEELSYLVFSLVPEFDHDGKVVSILKISRDISRIMRTEALLRRREQEFRTLAHNSPDMIVRYDRECRRIYLNPAYAYYTGIPISAAIHKTPAEVWTSLMPSDEFLSRLKRVMETRESDRMLLEWVMPDGSITTHLMHAVAECNDDGEVTDVLVIGHNITELKATERRLEESRAQLQLLTYHREEAREEERRRVAREIHDELGQLLSVLRLNVSTLEYGYGEANPDLRRKTAMMGKVIDQAIDMIHNLATRLRPAVLESGISLAIEWLVQEFSKSTGIHCEFDSPKGEIELEKDRALAIFRIVQESMTNILRHAEADRVEIILSLHGQELVLKIKDNGKGFIPEKASGKGSFGIIGMKERILMLGGSLEINSALGFGTELLISVPINEVKKAES